MAIIASEVMLQASILLLDAGLVRWPAPELHIYLNAGQREIALHKPTCFTDEVIISLVAGTRQSIPATAISLMRVVRNLSADDDPGPRVGAKAVTAIDRTVLDTQIPSWSDPTVMPFRALVDHVVVDIANPETFYVVPGNTGAGMLEATCAVMPTPVPVPSSPLLIASYVTSMNVPAIFENALVDYVMYRAFSKDASTPGHAQRAMAHYQQFAQAIGLKMQTDMALNPDKTRGA